MLDACGCAHDRQLEVVGDVGCARAVGVRGLHHANLQLFGQTSQAYQIPDEERGESGNAVAVKEAEAIVGIEEIVDYAIGIAVERGAAG